MKKYLIAATIIAGFNISGVASAQTAIAFQGNHLVTSGVGKECALLMEDVTLGVSANVHGAFLCDEAENLVQVGACHEGGSRGRGAACTDQNNQMEGDQLPEGCTVASGFSTIPSYIGFMASSAGGVLQEHALGGRCSGSTLTGLDAWGAE